MRSGIKKLFAGVIAAVMLLSLSYTGEWLTETAAAAEIGSAEAEKYDPRTEYTSPVHDQWDWGTCWAMSGISTAESFLIRESLADNSVFLSVEDVLWWVRGDGNGGWNYPRRDTGGYPPMVAGYLTTVGVRSNADIPYLMEPSDGDFYGSLFFETGENQKPANYDTASVLYEITDLVFLKNPTPEEIKELIVKYGAVAASYHDSREGLNEETGAYWYPYRDEVFMNHSVSVVGWDDNYPKENFRCEIKTEKTDDKGSLLVDDEGEPLYDVEIVTPEHDGAWILKNSYGTDYALDGFNYVSYDDGYLFTTDIDLMYVYCVAGARKPLDQKRYYYDQFGASGVMEGESSTSVWANVFDFGTEEQINELSFVTWSKGSTYRMYYAPVDGDVPSADESSWILLSEGTVEHAGYTTVTSSWEENVPAGKGAILLSVTGETPSIGTDEPLMEMNKPLFNPVQDKGTAFVLKDSGFQPAEVKRTMDNGAEYETDVDLCIRAYTVHCTPEALETPVVSMNRSSFVYTGKQQRPVISVTAGETTLDPSSYTVTWPEKSVNAGTYEVKVTLQGEYKGVLKAEYSITKAKQSIKCSSSKPTLTKGKSKKITVSGAKGKVTFSSKDKKTATVGKTSGIITAKAPGTVKITVTAAATPNYKKAEKTINVRVIPQTTAFSSLKGISKGFKATWEKVSGVTGYQIQYCTKEDFSSGAKIKTIAKNSTVTKKVRNLKAGKKYYVRIRTYKKVNGKPFYSKWSKKKTVWLQNGRKK